MSATRPAKCSGPSRPSPTGRWPPPSGTTSTDRLPGAQTRKCTPPGATSAPTGSRRSGSATSLELDDDALVRSELQVRRHPLVLAVEDRREDDPARVRQVDRRRRVAEVE